MHLVNGDFSVYMFAGGEQYGCTVDPQLWVYYSIVMQKSPPPFYNDHQYCMCNDLIQARFGLDIHSGIHHDNWLQVYKYLKNNMDA